VNNSLETDSKRKDKKNITHRNMTMSLWRCNQCLYNYEDECCAPEGHIRVASSVLTRCGIRTVNEELKLIEMGL
jgi:ribosomal protein L37AE/L43A